MAEKCHFCGKVGAPIFMNQIIGGVQSAFQLCEACAVKHFGPSILERISSEDQEATLVSYVQSCISFACDRTAKGAAELSAGDILSSAIQAAIYLFGSNAREKLWEIQIFSSWSLGSVISELIERGHQFAIRREILAKFDTNSEFDAFLDPAEPGATDNPEDAQ